MSYAAKIEQQLVTEIIVGDYEWANENLGGTWVDCTNPDGELTVAIGWSYIDGVFTPPPTPDPIEGK